MLGIEVDAEKLTFSLPEEAKNHLAKELSEWCKSGVRKRVREWQQLAGWINWAFNIFPLLQPSLNNIYAKLKGKEQGARVWTNTAMREDLEWAKSKLDESDGVRLFKSLAWDVHKATCVAMTDACPEGYAFWFPDLTKVLLHLHLKELLQHKYFLQSSGGFICFAQHSISSSSW